MIDFSRTSRTAGIAALCAASCLVLAQSPVSGLAVQNEIHAAIASGIGFYVLPDATIQLTKSLAIPPGTRNFTLIGQTQTKLVRSVNSDFPLLQVGYNAGFAFSNSGLYAFPRWTPAPIADGSSTISVPSGAIVAPGWYMIAGVHPVNDLVSISGTTSYNFRRELVRVTGQSGTTVTLSEPIGREYLTPELFQIELDTTPPDFRIVSSNIQVVNLTIQGRLGDIETDRTIFGKGSQVSKAMVVGMANNVMLDNVRVGGFFNSGINILTSKGVAINNAVITDGSIRTLGYGIEVSASRHCTITNSTMQDTRYGALFQSGSTDGYVFNCSIPPGRGAFDCGHGHDERRITYEQCRADRFVIGNQSWLRGVSSISLVNCTAYVDLFVAGKATNINITGKHPSEPLTSPGMTITTSYNPVGLPTGPTWPLSVRLENTVLASNFYPGRAIFFYSPNSTVAPSVGNLTVVNSNIRNPFSDGIGILEFGSLGTGGTVRFEGCTISNTASGSALTRGSATGAGSWDVTFQNSTMSGPSPWALQLDSGAKGIYRFNGSSYNGIPMASNRVLNNSGGTASFTITP